MPQFLIIALIALNGVLHPGAVIQSVHILVIVVVHLYIAGIHPAVEQARRRIQRR